MSAHLMVDTLAPGLVVEDITLAETPLAMGIHIWAGLRAGVAAGEEVLNSQSPPHECVNNP